MNDRYLHLGSRAFFPGMFRMNIVKPETITAGASLWDAMLVEKTNYSRLSIPEGWYVDLQISLLC
jgi:hypothetical protein